MAHEGLQAQMFEPVCVVAGPPGAAFVVAFNALERRLVFMTQLVVFELPHVVT